MIKYHKIQSVFKRDPENHMKTFLFGQYSTPEIGYLAKNEWVFTEKVDGTNIRVGWSWEDNRKVLIGGRTDSAQIPAHLIERLIELFPPEKMDEVFPGSNITCPVTLFGEGFGGKIQKGSDYIPGGGVDFVLFDVRVGDWWLKREDVTGIADSLGCLFVPLIDVATLDDACLLCEAGFMSEFGNKEAEGVVLRPRVELKDRAGHRIISKLKVKDFQ